MSENTDNSASGGDKALQGQETSTSNLTRLVQTEEDFQVGSIVEFGRYPQNITPESLDNINKQKAIYLINLMNSTALGFTVNTYFYFQHTLMNPGLSNTMVPSNSMVPSYTEEYDYSSDPIEWLVLENDGETALLLSRYGLDCISFHNNLLSNNNYIGWDNCYLRTWLNNVFLDRAFTSPEQRLIAESNLVIGSNRNIVQNEIKRCNDKVFCLSVEQIEQYLLIHERHCEVTHYAQHSAGQPLKYGLRFSYWLRSPGTKEGFATVVDTDGRFCDCLVTALRAVRPALRIKLNG